MNEIIGTWIATSPDKTKTEKYVFNQDGTFEYSTTTAGKTDRKLTGKFEYVDQNLTLHYDNSNPGTSTMKGVGVDTNKMCIGYKKVHANETTLVGVWCSESIVVYGAESANSTKVDSFLTAVMNNNKFNSFFNVKINDKQSSITNSAGTYSLKDGNISLENENGTDANTAYFNNGTHAYYIISNVLVIVNDITWNALFIKS